MIRPTATDLLRNIDATLVQNVEPSLGDLGGRSALATVRHLLNFVRLRIEREGQILTDDIAGLRSLLPRLMDYFERHHDERGAREIRDALGKGRPWDPARYPSLDDLADEAGGLREALHAGLARLQAMREARRDDPEYASLRAAIRTYMARQIEAEGEIVAPAFFGRGPRR